VCETTDVEGQPSGREPTIGDVARAAGVSVTTVSRVLRDHTDVGAATRARVQATIDRLGYRPSPIARALVAGRSRLLTLLVNDVANPFYPQLAKSVEQEAKKNGYTVAICSTADRAAETRRCLQRLLGQGLDGVIHASAARDEDVLLSLVKDHRRIVFTNRRPEHSGVSYVVSDNVAGAASLTRHLLSLGHRRVGFIAGPAFARNAAERLDGFLRAMGEVTGSQSLVAEGDFSEASGRRAVLEWLESRPVPTAIIAVNDASALGALGALADRRMRVPDDIAVAGFDGTRLSASPLIRLTTVDQHIRRLGRRSVQILLKQLAEAGDFDPVYEVLPTQLLVRGTTVGNTPDSRGPGIVALCLRPLLSLPPLRHGPAASSAREARPFAAQCFGTGFVQALKSSR
jgi:LacI family transcriptional regulator